MMRHWMILLALLAGCKPPAIPAPPPVPEPPRRLVSSARVPVELRQRNYTRTGSCWHAATITMLRWHGKHEVARWWRRNYSGGAKIGVVAAGLRKRGVAYRLETRGDPEFLEWVSQTGRVAGIHFQDGHAVNFAGFRDGKAIIIDNNRTHKNYTAPKKAFIKQWQRYGGDAIALTDLPPPPKPWR